MASLRIFDEDLINSIPLPDMDDGSADNNEDTSCLGSNELKATICEAEVFSTNLPTRPNPPMPSISRNPMGDVPQTASQGHQQYPNVQNVMRQPHHNMHAPSMQTEHATPMMFTHPVAIFPPRPMNPYPQQQYFVSTPCFTYPTPPSTVSAYFPMQPMQSCPAAVNNIPDSQPPQTSKRRYLSIINPKTGEDLLEDVLQNNAASERKETTRSGGSDAAVKFASRVAVAVAYKEPGIHLPSETVDETPPIISCPKDVNVSDSARDTESLASTGDTVASIKPVEETTNTNTTVALKAEKVEDQWSPLNPEGKKQYDREFLLTLQSQPMSLMKPLNLPNLNIIKDKAQVHKLSKGSRISSLPIPKLGMTGNSFDPFIPTYESGNRKPPGMSSSIKQSVKLHESENAWKPSHKNEPDNSEEQAQLHFKDLYKKVRGILNKLTQQKFDTLLNQVKKLDINTEEKLNGVIDLVFENAIEEQNFSVPYADMCKQLAMIKVPSAEKEGQFVNFRKLLLTKCQKEFEQDRIVEIQRAEKLKLIQECDQTDKKKQLQEDFDEKERKNRRRKLGNIRFIGELFKLGMLIEPIMHECIKQLLSQGDEDSLECLCMLLTTIGKELDTRKEKGDNHDMSLYFAEMQKIVAGRSMSSRVRFVLQDVIDLKSRNWIPRRDANNPKTIDQIHQEAQREAHEQQQMIQNMSFVSKRPSVDSRWKSPNTGRAPGGGYEDGWIQSSKGGKVNCSFDANKLKQGNISEEIINEAGFVRAFITTLFRHAITGPAEYPQLSLDKLKYWIPLLQYVVKKDDLQLEALYAVQALMNQLGQPKGVLRQIFDFLYDDDIITEETFKKWEVADNPAEQEGKSVALRSVASFFTWLREADEESEEG